MLSALRKMGNSTGLIVPKALLREAGLASGAVLELVVQNGGILALPVETDPRAGWAEDAALVAADPITTEEREWRDAELTDDAEWTW